MSEGVKKTGESGSLSKAVTVLRAIGDKPGSSLGELAKATGLARSTVQRLVASLKSEGLAAKTNGHQGVFLGMELARLGAKVNIDARALLLPLMAELHNKIGDNIDLTSLEGNKVIVIEQIASNEDIQVISFVGREHSVHCTANGKAHLSQLSNEDARALLAQKGMPAKTKNSITDPDRLMTQIEAYRDVGLFIDREEYGDDACAIATPLPSIGGRRLAIGVAVPAARFARREEDIKAELLKFRRAVQNNFGKSI